MQSVKFQGFKVNQGFPNVPNGVEGRIAFFRLFFLMEHLIVANVPFKS